MSTLLKLAVIICLAFVWGMICNHVWGVRGGLFPALIGGFLVGLGIDIFWRYAYDEE